MMNFTQRIAFLLPETPLGRAFLGVVLGLLAVYASVIALLNHNQGYLIYLPTQSVHLEERTWAWMMIDGKPVAYVREGKADMPVLIMTHGRSEDLWSIDRATNAYSRRGWTVVAPEYPGFAGLDGIPSESAIKERVNAVYDALIKDGRDPKTFIIQGNSLGSGPALELAQRPHALLVLSAPVANLSELVDQHAPFYPHFLLDSIWDNEELAKQVYPSPSFVAHAHDDPVVPPEHGRRLAAILHAKTFYPDKGGHGVAALIPSDVMQYYDDLTRSRLK